VSAAIRRACDCWGLVGGSHGEVAVIGCIATVAGGASASAIMGTLAGFGALVGGVAHYAVTIFVVYVI